MYWLIFWKSIRYIYKVNRELFILKKIKILVLFFFIIAFAQGQSISIPKKINGKIIADYNDLEGVYIINLKSEKSTNTERGGYFSINASIGDTLMFSAIQFKGLKVKLKEEDFQKELFFVKLECLVRMLDEVRINEYRNINEYSLSIVPSTLKVATPAERKLNAASNAYPTLGVGTSVGGSAGLDPVLNWMSGRTTMLKKELEVEKKETLMDKINVWYEDKYFIKTLKIPEDYVKGFKYYIVQDAKFVEAMKAKNRTMATFIMNELAVNYLQLLKEK